MANSQKTAGRILIVDDEEGMREGCRRALSPAGYQVDTAANLSAGLALIRKEGYDLYLLDVMLPDGRGLDLISLILEKDPNAICIVITGFGSVEMAVSAVRQGAYDFLSKPFTSDELLVAVNQGLERRRLKIVEAQAIELALAKAELEKLDKFKSQFMLKVAHELRAPVAAVQSYINLLLAGYIAEDEIKPTLSRLQERLEELLDLIADLLELARLKQATDQPSIKASPQPMADIVQEVCELFKEQAQEKKQNLRVEILDQPTIVADRDHMRHIWTNLISNAIKYTPEGGRISVSLQADEDQLIGTVEDSGIGIAEEEMQYLFQDFFRSDRAKASGEIGTGLGLSIVKQIVDSYGGEIEVTSKPGQGSRFTFTLPLEPPTETPAHKALPQTTNSGTGSNRHPTLPTTGIRTFILGDDSRPSEQS